MADRPLGSHAGARLVVGPGGNLLLRGAAQGRGPERFLRPRPDPRPAGRVRDPLQRRRHTLQLEVHPTRPGGSTQADRGPREPSKRSSTGRLTTPAVLTGETTKGREPYGDRVPVLVGGVTPAQGGRE